MSLSFGAELRARRLAAGISLTRFARSVNYSKSHISKIENGTKVPGVLLARLCDTALEADGRLAALAASSVAHPGRPAGGRTADGPWVLHLDPAGPGQFAVDPRWTTPTAPSTLSPWPISAGGPRQQGTDDIVNAFRAQFDHLRRLTQSLPPAAIIPVLVAVTHAMRIAASDAPTAVRTRLFLLAARYAELTGWMVQEAGDDAGAIWWTDLAVEYAAAGGDPRLAAFAEVRRADIAMYQRNGAKIVDLARAVQRIDCGGRIRGLAAQREAQGHAINGDYSACLRALDRAAAWFGRADDGQDEPVLGSSTVRDPIDMAAGWCMHDLGRPQEAARRLAGPWSEAPAWACRTRGRIGARYSLTLLASGAVEQGCATLDQVLDDCSGLRSATIRTDLREVGRHLHRHPTHPAVRQIMPRLTGALAA
jgi:hypothetical protein